MDWYWRRFVKNIGVENKNYGRKMVSITDEYMGVSQLVGARARIPPKKVYAHFDWFCIDCYAKVYLQFILKQL